MAIVGATAGGKTLLSLELADRLQQELGIESEVVCADKKTTRKGMGLGTAAPSEDELARVPHHMLGVFEAEDHLVPRWTYQAMARACMRDVTSRERLPMLVGGSVQLMEALGVLRQVYTAWQQKA